MAKEVKKRDELRDVERKVKSSVTHQGIGGKIYRIEMEIPNDEVFCNGMSGNFACMNFMLRRDDFSKDFSPKLFYGKVDGLGYVIAEDELE